MNKEKMLLMKPKEMNEKAFVDLFMRIQAENTILMEPDDKFTIAARIGKLSLESVTPVSDIKYIVKRAREQAELAMKRELSVIEKDAAQVVMIDKK